MLVNIFLTIGTFDHWHYHEKDNGQPYFDQNAGKLLEDF